MKTLQVAIRNVGEIISLYDKNLVSRDEARQLMGLKEEQPTTKEEPTKEPSKEDKKERLRKLYSEKVYAGNQEK